LIDGILALSDHALGAGRLDGGNDLLGTAPQLQ
jgi:hypothetical protein